MRPLVNDRWEGSFTVTELGTWFYTMEARIDHFLTWKLDFEKRFRAGQDLEVDREIGARRIETAAKRAGRDDAARLQEWALQIRQSSDDPRALSLAREEELVELMAVHFDPKLSRSYRQELGVTVESEKALFSAWYELFHRSCCREDGGHGTFRECEKILPLIAEAGFDVVYFPPIHPIGSTHRKGKNNAPVAAEEDPGSPWAIGSVEGGHKTLHPELGSLEDFERFLARAKDLGLQVADIAFRSPDHPRAGASRVVSLAARRHRAVCGKSAEEVRGHHPLRFRVGRVAAPLGGTQECAALLGRQGGYHLPGRQSPHQAILLLGMGDPGGEEGASGDPLSFRGVHPAQGDVSPGQTRLQPILYLLLLAQYPRNWSST
jgi:hypothetical protein